MDEKPLDLTALARRYVVTRWVVVQWVIDGFLPRPDWIGGEPYWWPGAIAAHDLIVHSGGGQPDEDKLVLITLINKTNQQEAYPYGQKKRRGRPRKAEQYLRAPIELIREELAHFGLAAGLEHTGHASPQDSSRC